MSIGLTIADNAPNRICYFRFGQVKNESRTNLNYKNFSENVKSNIKLRKLYKERTNKIKQVLIGVKQIEEDEVDNDSN